MKTYPKESVDRAAGLGVRIVEGLWLLQARRKAGFSLNLSFNALRTSPDGHYCYFHYAMATEKDDIREAEDKAEEAEKEAKEARADEAETNADAAREDADRS